MEDFTKANELDEIYFLVRLEGFKRSPLKMKIPLIYIYMYAYIYIYNLSA